MPVFSSISGVTVTVERRGIEPPSAHCERAVLPLNDLPICQCQANRPMGQYLLRTLSHRILSETVVQCPAKPALGRTPTFSLMNFSSHKSPPEDHEKQQHPQHIANRAIPLAPRLDGPHALRPFVAAPQAALANGPTHRRARRPISSAAAPTPTNARLAGSGTAVIATWKVPLLSE
jgi:hypothetical protein